MGYLNLVRTLSDLYRRSRKPTTEDGWLAARFFFRPLSFVVAPIFIYLGLSANQVTLLNVGVLAGALCIFVLGGQAAMIAAALLLFLFTVLDYVDGNIARYHGTSSVYGKMVDGALDSVGYLHFAAAALGNAWFGNAILPHAIEIGLGVGTFALLLFFSYFQMRLMYFRTEVQVPNSPPKAAPPAGGRTGVVRLAKETYMNALIAAPAVLPVFAVFDAISLYILFYFFLNAVFVPANILYSLIRARTELSAPDARAQKADLETRTPAPQ